MIENKNGRIHHHYDDADDMPRRRATTQTFTKIPVMCNGQFNNCNNSPTRMVVRYGLVRGYCDTCMLDMVLQAESVTIR
jgi:hypothetical protein